MGTTCLSVCPECARHVRCAERACPFCGGKVSSFMRVLEYRIVTRFDRSRAVSLGAALTAAGFAVGCEANSGPVYGVACTPMICPVGGAGAAAGASTSGGSGAGTGGTGSVAGSLSMAGAAIGEGGSGDEGGAAGKAGDSGAPATGGGGTTGEGGLPGEAGSSGEANHGGQGGNP